VSISSVITRLLLCGVDWDSEFHVSGGLRPPGGQLAGHHHPAITIGQPPSGHHHYEMPRSISQGTDRRRTGNPGRNDRHRFARPVPIERLPDGSQPV
jgi:hypothetical protein